MMNVLANTTLKDTGLYFDSDGMYPLSDMNWQDAIITATYDACVQKVGLVPRYLNDNYYLMSYIVPRNGQYEFIIESFLRGTTKIYTNAPLEGLTAPFTITCEIKKTFFTFKVNEKVLAKIEFGSIPNGQTQLLANAGETCASAEVKEPQAISWSHNGNTHGIVVKQTEEDDETQQFVLKSDGKIPARLTHTSPSAFDGDVTVSWQSIGQGKLTIGTQIIPIDSQQLKTYSVTIPLSKAPSLGIVFETSTTLLIQEPQIENGKFPTPYIPNDSVTAPQIREESILTYPAKDNFSEKEGTLYLSLFPKTTIENATLFTTNTGEMNLSYSAGKFIWNVKGQILEKAIPWNNAVTLSVTWSNNEISLSVNGEYARKTVSLSARKQVDNLIFTSENNVGYLVIDDIIVWSHPMVVKGIDPIPNEANILLKATFEKAIGGKGVSWFELPVAPLDTSPILVEKKDGTNMRKVSFFDLETGKYRTYNEEMFVYDGVSDSFDLSYDDLNVDFFDLMIRTEEGEIVGAPYEITNKRIRFYLSEEEKKTLVYEPLYVRYQLNDSYTVDYNIQAVDGYRVDFAKHDGQEKKVYQEGNHFGPRQKLATMIEMNPIMNQNHEGFLYITQNDQATATFKVTVTPEHLLADGKTSCSVIVEPLDNDGNFLGGADLDVKVDKGFIHRVSTLESALSQRRSGMYLYRYIAPFIPNNKQLRNIEENLWIVDKDSKIGIQYPFLLKPTKAAHPLAVKEDTKLFLEQKAAIFEKLVLHEGLEEDMNPTLFAALDLNGDGKVSVEDIELLEGGSLDKKLAGIYNQLNK